MPSKLKWIDEAPWYRKDQIKHFFKQYKPLERGKWLKVEGCADTDAAYREITDESANYKEVSCLLPVNGRVCRTALTRHPEACTHCT
jgi:hypothetical protein